MTQTRQVLDIPICHKMYELYKLLHSYQSDIPKLERYTLWQKCENTSLDLLEALIATSHRRGEERLNILYKISSKLDFLKILIRLAKETRTIDSKQYLAIQEIIQEIGKMVGGWMKAIHSPPPTEPLNSAG
jgi:hypothetical protein